MGRATRDLPHGRALHPRECWSSRVARLCPRGLREELLQPPRRGSSARRGRSGGISPPAAFCAARFFNGISPFKSIRGFNHITPRGEQRGSCGAMQATSLTSLGLQQTAMEGLGLHPDPCSLSRSFLEHPRPQGMAQCQGWRPHRGKDPLRIAGWAI